MILLLLLFLSLNCFSATALQAKVDRRTLGIDLELIFNSTHSISLHLLKDHGKQRGVETVYGRKVTKLPTRNGFEISSFKEDKNNALFSVETSSNPSNPKTLYYGSFLYRGRIYDLEPVGVLDAQPAATHQNKYDLTIEGHAYKLYEERQFKSSGEDELQAPFEEHVASMMTWFNSKLQDSIEQPGGRVIVEFLIALDASVYAKWLKATGEREKAIHNIKYYYTHIANGVRANYDLIQDPDYDVTMHLAGIYIAETDSDDPFSLDPSIRNGDYISPNPVLDKWGDFMDRKKSDPTFPSFDVTTAFTDYQTTGINGLAYVSQACKKNGVSINKDNGPYQSINTATHEIGHNLGANHDGMGNDCQYADQFVMAAGRDTMTEKNFMNQFIFSPCSITQFKNFLKTMKTGDCLRNVPASMPASTTQDFLSQHPGQKFTLDQQCSLLLGKKSTACASGLHNKNFCMRISCYDNKLKRCINPNLAPAEGTSCGNKKWCMRGQCVSDAQAPEFKDSCLTGDSKEVIQIMGKKATCKELIAHKPMYCQQTYYLGLCCESCFKLSQQNGPDCPYGDKFEDCKLSECSYMANECCETCSPGGKKNKAREEDRPKDTVTEAEEPEKKCRDIRDCSSTQAYECYEKSTEENCCETCEKFKMSDERACMYGDHGSWCKQRVKEWPDECFKSEGVKTRCCEACKGVKDKTTGCQDIDDCSDIQAKDCYDDDVGKNCCATCLKYRKGRTGSCRYGNRYNYCKKSRCKDESFASLCCEIC